MDNQQLSQQVGAMWTTCNMLNVLKSEDQPPETVNRTKAFPKLSELALAKTALTFHIANEELQAIIHPESLYSSHKEPASFLLSFADSAICSPSEAELTQSDINDVIHNLAGMEVKSTEQIGGHQDQLFTHIEESGVSMENQYAKFSQDGFNEYIRFPAQQSSDAAAGKTIDSFVSYSSEKPSHQCSNCEQIFTSDSFEEHICEYDENNQFIEDELPSEEENADEVIEPIPASAADKVKEKPQIQPSDDVGNNFPKHTILMKMLETNNATICKWLKSDYKLDLAKLSQPGETPGGSGEHGTAKKHDGPHCCTMCDRKFVHASGLSRHMEKHENDTSAGSTLSLAMTYDPGAATSLETAIKCTKCSSVFRRANDCLEHILFGHEIEQLFEDSIDFSDEEMETMESDGDTANDVDAANELTAALDVVILSSLLQCEFCDQFFSSLAALLCHSSTHDPRHGYECNGCDIRMTNIREATSHWYMECSNERFDAARKSSVQRYFVCNVCENKFTTPAQLYDHRRTNYHLFPRLSENGVLRMNCEQCGFLANTAKEAILHYQSEHQAKMRSTSKRSSQAAGAGAAHSSAAKEIIDNSDGCNSLIGMSLSKYRQYLCDVCGKSYTQSSHLWQHLRFHKGVKPFACQEPNCTRRFTIRPDLNDHIRKCHTGERPYHCQICGKRFLTGSVFYQHRLIHRGERRYGCDDCGKRFYRADALKNHQRIHTGEKPYACTQCQKTFRQRGDRDKHIRARHSGLMAAKESVKMAAAALATGKSNAVASAALGMSSALGRGRIRCKKDLLLQRPPLPRRNLPFGGREIPGGVGSSGIRMQHGFGEREDVVFIGSMAFPTSMFQPIVSDIDG